MTLSAQLQILYPASDLVRFTNPRDSTASVINTARFDAAISMAQTDFVTYVQEIYDDANADHINVCMQGVIAHLFYITQQDNGDRLKNWRTYLERYAKTNARKRFLPISNTPDESRKADFDRSRFKVFNLGTPSSDADSDEARTDSDG